jgi:tetratricopeptide (TPR) repeat protein
MFKYIISLLIAFALLTSACESDKKSKNDDGKKTSTIDEITTQISENSSDDALYFKRAKLYEKADSIDMAIVDMQKAIEFNHTNVDYYLYLADLFLKSGQLSNTLTVIQNASAIEPNNVELLLKTSEIYLMFKKYKETFEFANKALENDPRNDKAYFIRGYTHKELGDTAKAIENYEKAILYNPEHYHANVELGLIYGAAHNSLAVDYFKNAIRIDSLNPNAYYNLGMFYQSHFMENEALETYRELLKFNPNNQYAHYNMGYILLQLLKAPKESIPYFEKAIEIQNDYYQAYFNIGLAYETLGDIANARKYYQESLNYKTNYELAIIALNRIDKK